MARGCCQSRRVTHRCVRVPDSPRYAEAIADVLSSPRESLGGPFLHVIPVSSVGISFLGEPFGRETVAATDDAALRFDEAQIDLGEGPGWDAMRSARPVLEIDLADHGLSLWPLWTGVALAAKLGAVFAFPLRVGTLALGAVNLYSRVRRDLTTEQVTAASTLAGAAAVRLLRIALEDIDSNELASPTAGYSRREMHQAAGMVSVQGDMSVGDALVALRAHAFVAGVSAAALSRRVVDRDVVFDPGLSEWRDQRGHQ